MIQPKPLFAIVSALVVIGAAGLASAQTLSGGGLVDPRQSSPAAGRPGEGYVMAQLVSFNAARVTKARKVANLINADRCDAAAKMALKSGDQILARRTVEVCAARSSQRSVTP